MSVRVQGRAFGLSFVCLDVFLVEADILTDCIPSLPSSLRLIMTIFFVNSHDQIHSGKWTGFCYR